MVADHFLYMTATTSVHVQFVFKDLIIMKESLWKEGHPPSQVNFSKGLHEKKVDPFSNSTCPCFDCLVLTAGVFLQAGRWMQHSVVWHATSTQNNFLKIFTDREPVNWFFWPVNEMTRLHILTAICKPSVIRDSYTLSDWISVWNQLKRRTTSHW